MMKAESQENFQAVKPQPGHEAPDVGLLDEIARRFPDHAGSMAREQRWCQGSGATAGGGPALKNPTSAPACRLGSLRKCIDELLGNIEDVVWAVATAQFWVPVPAMGEPVAESQCSSELTDDRGWLNL